MARGFDGQRLPTAGRHRDIQVHRVGGDPIHRAGGSPEVSADDAHMDSVVVRDLRDVGGFHLLVARRRHFERGGKVGPQLEPVHFARCVALGHLLVDNPAPRRHPLHVAGGDGAAIAHAVAVLHGSGEHIGDGLDPAVRVPREARQVVLGNVVAEVVEQQKRVEIGRIAEAERAAQVYARAFESRLGFDEPLNRPKRHKLPPCAII